MFKVFFEDIAKGTVYNVGSCTVDPDEALAFAERYDPQPIHLNDDFAKMTPYGKICISGWQTCSMIMRLHVDFMTERGGASLGSPGVDDIRWLKPVYPGDTLHLEFEIGETRRSKSRPNMGFVQFFDRVTNQDGELVMTMEAKLMMAARTRGEQQTG